MARQNILANYPANATSPKNIYRSLVGGDTARWYIGSRPTHFRLSRPSNEVVLMCGNIYVDKTEKYITEDVLNTSIEGKNLYVPLYGSGAYIPTTFKDEIKVISPEEEASWTNRGPYKRVFFSEGEKTVADVIRHCWHYSYNDDANGFIELNDEGKLDNLLALRYDFEMAKVMGSMHEQFADMLKMLSFFLRKVSLSDEQKAMFPDIEKASDTEIATILYKYQKAQELIAEIRKDPKGYLEKNYNSDITPITEPEQEVSQ